MKRLFTLLALVAAFAWSASAQSYNYLTFQQTDGAVRSLSLDGLKLTFAEGNLVATNGTTQTTFPLSALQKMFFSSEAVGIHSASADSPVGVRIEGGTLHVDAPSDSEIAIYGIDGRRVPSTGLGQGVYVVKVNGKTYKVLAK